MPENSKLSWKPSVWKSKNKMSEIFTQKWEKISKKVSATMNSLQSWLPEWVQETPRMKYTKYSNFLIKIISIKLLSKTWKELQVKLVKKSQMKNWKKCLNKPTEMVTECSTLMNFTALWEEEVILLMTLTVMTNEWKSLHDINGLLTLSWIFYFMNLSLKIWLLIY